MSVCTADFEIPKKRRKRKGQSRQEVIAAIVNDAQANGIDCNESDVSRLISELSQWFKYLDKHGYKSVCSVYEFRCEHLSELLSIVPDRVMTPRRGTSHYLLGQFLFQGRQTLIRISCDVPEGHCVLMVYEH